MYFYEVAILKSPLNNLTYQSEKKIEKTKVLVKLRNRKVLINSSYKRGRKTNF